MVEQLRKCEVFYKAEFKTLQCVILTPLGKNKIMCEPGKMIEIEATII